jgi:hypothetical protein
MEQNNGIEDSSASIDLAGGVYGDLYGSNYDSLYHGQHYNPYTISDNASNDLTDLSDLTSDVFHNDPPKKKQEKQ